MPTRLAYSIRVNRIMARNLRTAASTQGIALHDVATRSGLSHTQAARAWFGIFPSAAVVLMASTAAQVDTATLLHGVPAPTLG